MKIRPLARSLGRSFSGLLALAATGALAQGEAGLAVQGGELRPSGTGGRGFFVTPTLSASATLTDNVNLSATDKKSDLLLQLSPGIQVSGQSGRVKGFLNYSLTGSFSARESDASSIYNTLSAQLDAEVVPSRFFVEANASISQQFISPFGTQSLDPSLNNRNSTEVYTVGVAPRVEGQILGQVDYLGRAFYTYTNSGTSQASDSSTFGGILSFNGTSRWPRLGWGLNFSYREINFSEGRSEFDQLNWVALRYAVVPELTLTARANSERSNVTSLDTETHFGYGGGLVWNPSPRTELIAQYDTRIFGSSHLYAFNYRSPRTVWSISSRQGLSNGQALGGDGGIYGAGSVSQGTAFELLFAQFASVQPDPVLRTQLVNDFLRANGINPNSTLDPSYLPSQVTEQLSQNASVAWLGLRSTLIFSVNQTQSRNLGPLSNPGNSFADGQTVKWRGFSLAGSHRLTPRASLSASYSQTRTMGSDTDQETNFWSTNLMLTNQIGQRTSGSLMVRRSVQSGFTGYNENALLATLNMQF